MSRIKYWIAVVSKDHLQRGIAGSFMQVNHGKEAPLKRMHEDDHVIFYSPKISFGGEEKCQAFTAIGRVTDDQVYQHEMAPGFIPFRRNIQFYESTEVSIIPLIAQLEFIVNKRSWGYPFRTGFFEISEKDYNLISGKMLQQ